MTTVDNTDMKVLSASIISACQLNCNAGDVIKLHHGQQEGTAACNASDTSANQMIEEKVATAAGVVTVHISGDRKKAAILTYHDLGLNALACFQNFFEFVDVAAVVERFCVYHINAPGQEEDAAPFKDDFVYPSLDDLAGSVEEVVKHFNLKIFIGFGVGAGANILCRYALRYPKSVDALVLVNCSGSSTGWIEWGYQKANVFYLRNRGSMNNLTVDYLMWHNFGRTPHSAYDKATLASYRSYFSKIRNPKNLAGFIDSYVRRSALNIRRQGPTMQCPVLQIVGARSPHLNETIQLNKKLEPSRSDWFRLSDCGGMVLEEKPDKVAEAILLFLQGQGYLPSVSHVRWVARRPSGWLPAKQQRSVSVFALPSQCRPHQSLSGSPPISSPSAAPGVTFKVAAVSQRRSHSIAAPTAQQLADDPLFRMFDAYHAKQSKSDKRWPLEPTTEESPSRHGHQNDACDLRTLAEGTV